jgi:CRP/FNR family cyclic AMP-dependent transcriptional regulator
MVKPEMLRQCELFSELEDAELQLIAPLCRERAYDPGETICVAEEEADELFILQEGQVSLHVKLSSVVERSGDVTIDALEPGRIFGWSAIVKQQRFTATARATQPTKVLAIRASELHQLFNQNTHIGFVVMKQLADVVSSRLRRTRLELEEKAWAGG